MTSQRSHHLGRPGRPQLPPHLLRLHRVTFGCNKRELDLLETRATTAGLLLPDLSRTLALYGQIVSPTVPQINFAAVAELNRLGKNFNQLLLLLSRDDVPVPLLDVRFLIASIAEIQAHLTAVHGALIADREKPR